MEKFAAPRTGAGLQGLWQWVRKEARILGPLVTLFALIVIFALIVPGFFRTSNLINIAAQASFLLILALGITLVLLLGEIDLSFANLATLTGVALVVGIAQGLNPLVSLLLAIGAGLTVGLINGLVTVRIGVPSFITTLAMLTITHGAAIFITQGRPFFDVPVVLRTLATGRVAGVPIIILIALFLAFVFYLILTHTRFGRYIYMVGGNRMASHLAGVNVKSIVTSVFIIAALMSTLSGLLGVGRLGSAQAGAFSGLMIDGLAAVVIGGTSLFGGAGGVINTVIGVVFYTVLRNGLDLAVWVDIYLRGVITGTVLLLALIFNVYLQRLTSR